MINTIILTTRREEEEEDIYLAQTVMTMTMTITS